MTATDKTGELVLFYLAAFIHEASHLLIMSVLSAKPREILLVPGGINIVQSCCDNNFYNILILISGPLSNFILFLTFRGSFSSINLLLCIYNLMPLEGLDGGRILKIILLLYFREKTVDVVLSALSIVFVICFVLLFLIGLRENMVNLSVLIFSLYIISSIFLKKRLKEIKN